MPIRRGDCPVCPVTHAILPEDVCAYRDLSLDDLATVLSARGPTEAARLLEVSGEAWIRKIRRWRREARSVRARQAERILPELDDPAPWWQRAQESYGSLTQWRRREWVKTGYFATVLLGLFRCGRAPWLPARAPT